MIVFFDPATGQVMAVYTTDTTSAVWAAQGFIRAQVPPGPIEAEVARLARDAQVTVFGGVVTGVMATGPNPIQPGPAPNEAALAAHHANLAAGTINLADLLDMLRLERRL